MNASAIMKLMSAKNEFTRNHPKFVSFLKAAASRPIEEGTIIEVTMQRPGEEPVTANLKVKQSDLGLFESLKDIVQ